MNPLFPNPILLNNLDLSTINQSYAQLIALRNLSSTIIASQEQALRSQVMAVMQIRNQMLQAAAFNTPKIPFQPQPAEAKIEETASTMSFNSFSPKKPIIQEIRTPLSTLMTPKAVEQPKAVPKSFAPTGSSDRSLIKAQLEEMIYFILNNVGKIDQAEIEKARRRYSQNLYLVPIFDSLVAKYFPVKKHREDIVRCVIRRALKYLKSEIISQEKVYGKRAYAVLCKKYFHISPEKIEKSGINIEDEKELIEFLLPYRKNSKNRTMNSNFTSEIFSSQEFCDDYRKFLDNFDSLLIGDNKKKVQKLISLAEECVINNCPEKIKKCTRLPWLESWIEKTREVAFDLLNSSEKQDDDDKIEKKVKSGDDESHYPQGHNIVMKFEGSH